MKGGFCREEAESFEGFQHRSLWSASGFRAKPLLVVSFSLAACNYYFTNVLIPITCLSILCKWKKIKIHFPRQVVMQ